MSVNIYIILLNIYKTVMSFFFKSVSKKYIYNRYVPDLVYYEVTHDTVHCNSYHFIRLK